MKKAAIGIDIGGTKTLCVLADENSEIVESRKFKTAPQEGRRAFTKALLRAVNDLQQEARSHRLKIEAVGVGCAGRVDARRLRIVSSPNLLFLEDYPIGKHLRRRLRTDIILDNDVQMGILGEHELGAAKGKRTALGVFFGTGVGGAAVIDNRLYKGASGMGGQIGAVLAQPLGGPKAALSHGIVDRIASKGSIAGEALMMAIKEWAPFLHKRVGTDLAKVTWGLLARSVKHGDKKVEEMLRARMRVVGIALSSVVNFLNPDMVVSEAV